MPENPDGTHREGGAVDFLDTVCKNGYNTLACRRFDTNKICEGKKRKDIEQCRKRKIF